MNLFLAALILGQQPPPQDQPKPGFVADEGLFGRGVTCIPIPFVSNSRNLGTSYGILTPFLIADEKGDITRLLVPKFEYFQASSANFSADFFGYPDATSYYDFFALKALIDDERYAAEYRSLRFQGSEWALYGQAVYEASNSQRFFGLGPGTVLSSETNYLLRAYGAKIGAGYHLLDQAVLYYQERFRTYAVSVGGLSNLPYTGAVFPTLPGLNGGTVVHEEFRFAYDDRDSEKTPSRGYTASLWMNLRHYFEALNGVSPSAPIWGGGAEITGLWELTPNGAGECKIQDPTTWRFRTAARIRYEVVKGDSGAVPFLEMVTYGGDTMRGFDKGRFTDLCGFLFSIEERMTVWDITLFGVKGQLEIAPFLDTGKVFSNTGDELFGHPGSNYQLTYGVAVRGVIAPFVVGRVEVGIGQDGLNVFVGLHYPY